MIKRIEYSFENLHQQSIGAMIRAAYGFIVPERSEPQPLLRQPLPRADRRANAGAAEFNVLLAAKGYPNRFARTKGRRP